MMTKKLLILFALQNWVRLGGYHDPPCKQDRTVIVEVKSLKLIFTQTSSERQDANFQKRHFQFYGWNLSDIATECEEHLGPAGFCAVHLIITHSLGIPARNGLEMAI